MDSNNQYNIIRHCPGSDAITSKVLRQIKLKSAEPKIANICPGTGEQALLLAKAYKNVVLRLLTKTACFFILLWAKQNKQDFRIV